jgi:hypothetical protein
MFSLKSLNKLESKSSTMLEDSDAEVDFNSAWKTVRDNVQISAKESLD